MSTLFQTSDINGMTLANRFVRSATWEGMAAEDGAVTPQLIRTMTGLAGGGVGLIVTGHTYVSPEGKAGPWQLGVYKDELVDGLREMTTAVHDRGGKIVLQLAHAGHFAAKDLIEGPPWWVSDVEGLAEGPRHEITDGDIRHLVSAFADAARRARAAGFDGVQIHSAHGYLLSQFLSPIFNHRTDAYGGDIGNRCRIHLEVYRAVRDAVGPDYPVMIKMNGRDYAENGLTLEDAVFAAKALTDAGLDALEVSGGLLNSKKLSPVRGGINAPEKEAYFREEAEAIRKAIQKPVILVGGNRSFEVCESMVTDSVADYISMSRPLIREPGLINRWRDGDRRPATCDSDNLCFKPAHAGKGVYCLTAEREGAA